MTRYVENIHKSQAFVCIQYVFHYHSAPCMRHMHIAERNIPWCDFNRKLYEVFDYI